MQDNMILHSSRFPVCSVKENSCGILVSVAALFIVSTVIGLLLCRDAMAISISKEKELSVEFMDAIEKQDKLIRDPMALSLVRDIGERILKVLPPQPFRYKFYIMDEDQFNAFAGPGSNIFVHRGLITALDNAEELAGILGHEIAHSSCRHVSDMVDQSKIMTLGTLAGVLAGVLVGVTGGESGGELAPALTISSMAAGQTAMLSYSRDHETEADQKGLIYLTKAGFDPSGLLTGLKKIRSTDWFGSEGIPDYLKTHPGSADRIVQIQSWIDTHKKEFINKKGGTTVKSAVLRTDTEAPEEASEAVKKIVDKSRFEMVKYRLEGLYGNEDDAEKILSAALKKDPENCAVLYGMALLKERKERLGEAMEYLRKALAIRPLDTRLLLEVGKVYLLSGEPEKALEVMQSLESTPETEMELKFNISQAMLLTGSRASAEEGFQKIIDSSADMFPKAYYFIAQIKGEDGDAGLSHYYLGLYYHDIGNIKSARFHLMKSLDLLRDEEKKKHARELIKHDDREARSERRR